MFLFLVSTISAARDSDLDGITDDQDQYPNDYDNDGMPDIWEKQNGLRYDVQDGDKDPDQDGITNIEEYKAGTNPLGAATQQTSTETEDTFSPFEISLIKIFLWSAAAFALFFGVGILIFKAHIIQVLKGLIHIGKTHAQKPEPKHKQKTPKSLSLPNLPPKTKYRKPNFYFSPQYQQQKNRLMQKQQSFSSYNQQSAPRRPINDLYIPIEQLKLEQDPLYKLRHDYLVEKPDTDAFSRLKEHTSNRKKEKLLVR